jgi:glyoxylase-like metal-dependent hydrolase (beta-lactamase superfamily II)/rhodanese-related sulfurtransferase
VRQLRDTAVTGDPPNLHFQQYYLDCLSQASYLIGDRVAGVAAVVDPRRDVDEYVADAEELGLRITHVIETHFHADFLSGHLELASRTGAEIVYGAAAAGRVGFPIREVRTGDRIELGDVVLEIRETPGHTPESISIVVRAGPSGEPFGVLTGDTMFIGDVGRPDLLSAAGQSSAALARQLYRSLREQLLTLPDATKVFPAHGAGSACGKQLSTETVSTIGEQRRTNYALAPMSEDDFVHAVLEGQAAAPLYFSFAANRNREAHEMLAESPTVESLGVDDVLAHQAAGAVVIDGRDAVDFAAGHLPGSINVGLGGRFAEYVGEVVVAGTPIVLVTDPGQEVEAKVRLARIGFDNVLGALGDAAHALLARPDLVARSSRLTASELAERRDDVAELQLVDVRGAGEVAATGTLAGAHHIPLAALVTRLGELDPAAPTVVFCAGGYRSSIAASTMRAGGFTDVSDVIGGYTALAALASSA